MPIFDIHCQACGYRASGWLGRCPECGGWNTFVEGEPAPRPVSLGAGRFRLGGRWRFGRFFLQPAQHIAGDAAEYADRTGRVDDAEQR